MNVNFNTIVEVSVVLTIVTIFTFVVRYKQRRLSDLDLTERKKNPNGDRRR